MPSHAFVDENKVGGLTLFAAVIDTRFVTSARAEARRMRHPGSTRFHAKKEKPQQIKKALDIALELPVKVRAYDLRHLRHAKEARTVGVQALARDLVPAGVDWIVLERDESLLRHDEQVLYRETRGLQKGGPYTRYDHLRAHEEPLLWVADLVAWCWHQKRLQPSVSQMVTWCDAAAA